MYFTSLMVPSVDYEQHSFEVNPSAEGMISVDYTGPSASKGADFFASLHLPSSYSRERPVCERALYLLSHELGVDGGIRASIEIACEDPTQFSGELELMISQRLSNN